MTVRMTHDVVLKDPSEVLDFTLDWSGDLIGSEIISTSSWAADAGITKDSDSKTDTTAKVTLSAGTVGADYFVTNTIVTDGGRTLVRTLHVKVRTR